MPGPVSDCYDPEFGTAANRDDVKKAIEEVRALVASWIGPQLKPIVAVAQSEHSLNTNHIVNLTEKQLRLIRYCLHTTAEIL